MLRRTLPSRWLSRTQHSQSNAIVSQIIAVPRRRDVVSALFDGLNACAFITTYAIIVNWIYQGHLDLWDGTYGIEDDDEDDD